MTDNPASSQPIHIETRPRPARAMRYDGTWESARALTEWCSHAKARHHSNTDIKEPVVEVRIGGQHLQRFTGGPTTHVGGELLRVEPGEWLVQDDVGAWNVLSQSAFEHAYRDVHPLDAAAHDLTATELVQQMTQDPEFMKRFNAEVQTLFDRVALNARLGASAERAEAHEKADASVQDLLGH